MDNQFVSYGYEAFDSRSCRYRYTARTKAPKVRAVMLAGSCRPMTAIVVVLYLRELGGVVRIWGADTGDSGGLYREPMHMYARAYVITMRANLVREKKDKYLCTASDEACSKNKIKF